VSAYSDGEVGVALVLCRMIAARTTISRYADAPAVKAVFTGAAIRYDTRCYFNVRSKADISQLNLPHGTDN